jgi:hypothetical protein
MMADFLPEWYKGSEYVNVEDLFHDFLQPLIPLVRVTHWIAPEEYGYEPFVSDGADPVLRLWRQPGQWDIETNSDIPLLQVAAVTRSHDESWELLEFVRSVMKMLAKHDTFKITMADGTKVQVGDVKLWLGPQIVPEGPVDQYFIPMTFQMSIPGKKLQPDYYSIIKNLEA